MVKFYKTFCTNKLEGYIVTKKERVRKHSTLIAFNEPRRPCSPKILTHNSDL